MRCPLLLAFLAVAGCGKAPTPASTSSSTSPPSDPLVARREDDAQAAYSLDAAVDAIGEAMAASKKLAPTAGGDAKEALLNVAEMFDSAGATLAEHNDAPPPLDEYRRASPERTSERQKSVDDALDALHQLRDAQGTLDDLAQNVPTEHKAPLETIQHQTDEAIDDVEGAIKRLGGKVPPEDGDAGG